MPTTDAATSERLFPPFDVQEVHGVLWSRYLLRNTNHETDNDFLQSLSLDVGDPRRDKFTFSFQGDWSADLDGRSNPSAFYSVKDTFDNSVNGRLIRAYVDGNRIGPVQRVRFGRQPYAWVPELVDFDGISGVTEPLGSWNVAVHAVAGVPTHLYESPTSGDSAFGGGVEIAPGPTTSASVDALLLRDALVTGTERDTLVTAAVRQQIAREWVVAPRMTGADGDFRDTNVVVSYAGLENGWSGQFSYYALFHTQRREVTEIDPFFEVVEERHPYEEFRLLASKDIDERWTLDGGIWWSELFDANDEGTFNHDYKRYYLTPTIHDWPLDRMSLSATAEIFWTHDQSIMAYGFDATRKFTDTLQISLGSEYSLFDFDPELGGEREDVELGYARARWDVTKALRADVGVEFEWDSQDAYRVLRLGLAWRF